MKRYSAILLLVSLLLLVVSGCAFQLIEAPPEPESQDTTEAPTSYPATKPEDIVGVWDHAFMGQRVPIRYAEDGTLYYYMGSFYREEALGEYWFEDDKLHFVESLAGLNTVGIYSVTVELENGEPVRLSLTGIDDPDGMRKADYEQGLLWMEEVPSSE